MYVISFIYFTVLCIMVSMRMMYLNSTHVYSFSLSYPVICTVDDCAFLILFAKRHSEQMYIMDIGLFIVLSCGCCGC